MAGKLIRALVLS
ncbi:uncharacterized protein FFE2_16057 [Fusarium fujikuroi]|nr:uncharacterized protein FFE2_16057 [Fusarium fujikuroi]